MFYSTGYGNPVHKDCSNFVNGICRLNGAPVDPNGPACPRFKSKSTTKTILAEVSYPVAKRLYQTRSNMGQVQPPLSTRARRVGRGKGMRARGMGRVRGMKANPYHPLMQLQTQSLMIREPKKDIIRQQLEELEKQLKEVKDRLEKLR